MGAIMTLMGRRIDIEQQLKRTLNASELSRADIARKSNLSEAQLSYFVNGKRSLTLGSAAELARVLGLELRPIIGKAKSKKAK